MKTVGLLLFIALTKRTSKLMEVTTEHAPVHVAASCESVIVNSGYLRPDRCNLFVRFSAPPFTPTRYTIRPL
jgi:hypothetical protein